MVKSKKIKNICCLGAGYVGGPTMAVIADKCEDIHVNVVDICEKRIESWNNDNLDKLPVYEPGLREIILKKRNINLFFSTNIKEAISAADIIFVAVNTPTKLDGFGAGYASDLKYVESSIRKVAQYSVGHTIVVEKSTVPVKTAKIIKDLLNAVEVRNDSNLSKTFSVLSSPEFLAEGSAINDLENPDRILIGGEDELAIESLKNIYSRWIPTEKILVTNLWSSELSKLVSNAFLAQRISSINSISALCEKTGAKINQVSKSIGLDNRVGSKFLKAGPAFGGSCFQKDILSLVYLCKYYGLNDVAEYWESVVSINNWQRNRISNLIVETLFNTVSSKKIALLGFSYKANTNDTRESASIFIAKDLLKNGAVLSIHDPQVNPKQIKNELGIEENENYNENSEGCWSYFQNLYEAVKNADAIIILTEWEDYENLDWQLIYSLMRKPAWIFDTRSIISSKAAIKAGLKLWELGKGYLN